MEEESILKEKGDEIPTNTVSNVYRDLWIDYQVHLKCYRSIADSIEEHFPPELDRLSKLGIEVKLLLSNILIITALQLFFEWKEVSERLSSNPDDEFTKKLVNWIYLLEDILMTKILKLDNTTRNITLDLLKLFLDPNSNKPQDLPDVTVIVDDLISVIKQQTALLPSSSSSSELSSTDIFYIWFRDLIVLLLSISPPEPESLMTTHTTSMFQRLFSGSSSTTSPIATTTPIYNARTRQVVVKAGALFGVHIDIIRYWERDVGHALLQNIRNSKDQMGGSSSVTRKVSIGLAVAGGGVLLALTGGLAAPAIAVGLVSVGSSLGVLGAAGAIAGGVFVGVAAVLTVLGITGVAVIFGVGGATLTAWRMTNRLGDLQEFEFHRVPSTACDEDGGHVVAGDAEVGVNTTNTNPTVSVREAVLSDDEDRTGALELYICVNGWITADSSSSVDDNDSESTDSIADNEYDKIMSSAEPYKQNESNGEKSVKNTVSDIRKDISPIDVCCTPWIEKPRYVDSPVDIYALKWESKQLRRLDSMIESLLQRQVASTVGMYVVEEASKTVAAALTLPVWVLRVINGLDNAWDTASAKAELAGEVLALVLMDRKTLGYRPISLIGYSMGTRVIFRCLKILYDKGEFCCVQNVLLAGAPILGKSLLNLSEQSDWMKARAVVSGRFINGYNASDWILSFLFRYMEWGLYVAGLHPVNVPGIEDVNLSDIVHTHREYAKKMSEISCFVHLYK